MTTRPKESVKEQAVVLVDTNIWSLALRRKITNSTPEKLVLIELIQRNEASLIGLIKMELLSGIKSPDQFRLVREQLSAFHSIPTFEEDFITGAEFSNKCRRKGIQGNPIDFIICAIAYNNDLEIFTLDGDFQHYQKYLPIKLLDIK